MATKDTKENKTDREERWEAYVANYISKNPVKGKAKKERGEFDTVPASFV